MVPEVLLLLLLLHPGGQVSYRSELPHDSHHRKLYTDIKYYFDVDTPMVKERLKASLKPIFCQQKHWFAYDVIKEKPDLYGPIWIQITWVLLILIASVIAEILKATTPT